MIKIQPDDHSVFQDKIIKKGLGKVYFLRHLDHINIAFQEGFNAKMIWHDLHQQGQMPIMYNQFLFYCQTYIEGYGRKAAAAVDADTASTTPPSPDEATAPKGMTEAPSQAPVPQPAPRRIPPPPNAAESIENWTGRVDHVKHLFAAAKP